MRDREQRPKNNADTTNDDVSNAEEWVLTPHDGSSRYQNRLRSSILGDWKSYVLSETIAITSFVLTVLDLDLIHAAFHGLIIIS